MVKQSTTVDLGSFAYLSTASSTKFSIRYCPFVSKLRVIYYDKLRKRESSQSNFLDQRTIDLRRAFLCYVQIFLRIFDHSVSFPRLFGGLYGQNLPYKFKKSRGDSRNFSFVSRAAFVFANIHT